MEVRAEQYHREKRWEAIFFVFVLLMFLSIREDIFSACASMIQGENTKFPAVLGVLD